MSQPTPIQEGLERALRILYDRAELCIDGDVLLEDTRPAIAAVKIALHKERRQVQAENASASPFSLQPVRIQYVKGQRMRSPNGLTCAYVGRPPLAIPSR